MLRLLGPRLHGVLDYLLAAAFLAAPQALELAYPAEPLAYLTGGVYLGMALFTRYPLGMLEMIPFPVHGVIEAVLGCAWIAMPWVLEFAHDPLARNLYVGAGAALLIIAALTGYLSTGARAWHERERRHNLVDRRQRALAVRANQRRGPADRRRYAAA
jgi:hypothetical protein